jgi:hypothetical protein
MKKTRGEHVQDVHREVDEAYAAAEHEHPLLMLFGRWLRGESWVCRSCGRSTYHVSRLCRACRRRDV